jgi:ADP-dependent NAD(P)H-hydrate dehydratase / NAD(P)H-hydrate epimerase
VKVLTEAETREIDRRTIEVDGVAGIALMENAAHRVAEAIEQNFDPIHTHNMVIVCGKGNNGGDGLALARLMADKVARLRVIVASRDGYTGDAKTNLDRLEEVRIVPSLTVPEKLRERREVTIVVDAVLGTGLQGPPRDRALELIQAIRQFPEAKVVAIDVPSGLGGGGECVKADITVTFTAPKVEHYLASGAEENVGRLLVTNIGCPPQYVQSQLELSTSDFRDLFLPRKRDAHKGDFGHVLVIGGAPGKTGAAAMAGTAALRIGAGLVTVTAPEAVFLTPELMTEPLDAFTLERKTVLAIGPGLGDRKELVRRVLKEATVPVVIDADGINAIAGTDFQGRGLHTILTPHPGEMARLLDRAVGDRVADARAFAQDRNACLVLKGHRTLIAFPDGRVYINMTGSPAMAKAGSGDILTGMIAGLVAQFPNHIEKAVRAAVMLHGRAGELAEQEWTDKGVLATDLLRFVPRAIHELV